MYSWTDVAAKTERIYDIAAASSRDDSMIGRLRRYYKCGSWFGKFCCCIAVLDVLYCKWLEWWQPAMSFEIEPNLSAASVICTICARPKQEGVDSLRLKEE